jgi:hypothetical protein
MMDPLIRKAGARYPLEDFDLVIWERDPHIHNAGNLYIVMGSAKPVVEYPAKRIGLIRRPMSYYSKPIIAAESELVPISSFGLVARQFPWAGSRNTLRLDRDESLPVTATRSDGSPMRWAKSMGLDHINYCGAVDFDFFDMVTMATHRERRAA